MDGVYRLGSVVHPLAQCRRNMKKPPKDTRHGFICPKCSGVYFGTRFHLGWNEGEERKSGLGCEFCFLELRALASGGTGADNSPS